MASSIADFLSTVRGFDQLEPQDLEAAADGTTEMVYGPTEKLIRKGSPGERPSAFWILE